MLVFFIYPVIGILLILLILYSFVYEPANFKLSEINILVREKGRAAGTISGSVQSPCIYETGVLRKCLSRNYIQQRDHNIKIDAETLDKPVLTILHISDFHLRKNFKGKKLFNFIQGLGKLEPDLIFITGDLLAGSYVDYLIKMLSPLRAKKGKYAIFGVHDHYDKALVEFLKNMFKRKRRYSKENDIKYLIRRLNDIGIEVLMNEKRIIPLNCKGINDVEIFGLDDPVIERTDIGKAFSPSYPDDKIPGNGERTGSKKSYKEVFSLREDRIHVMREKNKLRLVMLHTPDSDSIIKLSERKADIIFCGHTHGGQVRLPFIGAIISGCRIRTKFASGLFYFKDVVLFTTRGLGEGKYTQFRFYCQPEANLVSIYKVD
jgi:uncharacterized protein